MWHTDLVRASFSIIACRYSWSSGCKLLKSCFRLKRYSTRLNEILTTLSRRTYSISSDDFVLPRLQNSLKAPIRLTATLTSTIRRIALTDLAVSNTITEAAYLGRGSGIEGKMYVLSKSGRFTCNNHVYIYYYVNKPTVKREQINKRQKTDTLKIIFFGLLYG